MCLLDFSMAYPLGCQKRYEIDALFFFLEKQKIKICAEIGVLGGGTTLALAFLVSPLNGKVFALDLFPPAQSVLYRYYPQNRLVTEIKGDCASKDVIDEFKKKLGSDKLDFLFIDADHSYAAVKRDYENFEKFVRPGGFIGFHDILDTELHRRANIQVCRFWNELKNNFKNWEFIEKEDLTWGGIGLIQKP